MHPCSASTHSSMPSQTLVSAPAHSASLSQTHVQSALQLGEIATSHSSVPSTIELPQPTGTQVPSMHAPPASHGVPLSATVPMTQRSSEQVSAPLQTLLSSHIELSVHEGRQVPGSQPSPEMSFPSSHISVL